MDFKLKVLGARAVILEDKQDNKTTSGIVIPGKDKEPTFKGTVISVGTGAYLENGEKVPMTVNTGDRVIFTNWSGSPVEVDGITYTILNERDILCIIED